MGEEKKVNKNIVKGNEMTDTINSVKNKEDMETNYQDVLKQTNENYTKKYSEISSGDIVFRQVWNDGSPEHLISLACAKNIFAAQLPKMPKEYITRQIFNHDHRTMCIITPNGIIGGICFRPFYEQRFAEIVFCAIISTEQEKGYGTRIMNHLKEHVKTEGIEYFLTYADNSATEYFKKQGFSKVLSMIPNRWKGFVKDYDGATLMECRILKSIDYLNLYPIINKQLETVYERIQQIGNIYKKYPGLVFPPPPHLASSDDPNAYDISKIPGVLESGWKPNLQSVSRYKNMCKYYYIYCFISNVYNIVYNTLQHMKTVKKWKLKQD